MRKDFIALLREHHDIDRHTRWLDARKRIDNDVRYKAVVDSALREEYFQQFIKLLKEERKRAKERDRDRKERKAEKKDKEKENVEKDKKERKSYDSNTKSDNDNEKHSTNIVHVCVL